ncbi:MAG TPA: hypothetical protein VLM11_07720 [Streptosporangiaceae bacterium]|nr:hypothetical protein [Streptosporangiaceae bacterium]
MRPPRRGSALLSAAVIALLLAACTSSTTRSTTGTTSPTTMSGHISARPNGPSTASATPTAESVLDCGNYINGNAAAAPLRVVLGVVGLPISPGYPALQTALSGGGNGALRLFAKTGLRVRPGTEFELLVPARFTSRLSIGWGNPGTPSHRVVVNNCPQAGSGWLAYPGGYWIDHPACVQIIVRAGSKQQLVHIGVGTACPGQRPPQGPSQS